MLDVKLLQRHPIHVQLAYSAESRLLYTTIMSRVQISCILLIKVPPLITAKSCTCMICSPLRASTSTLTDASPSHISANNLTASIKFIAFCGLVLKTWLNVVTRDVSHLPCGMFASICLVFARIGSIWNPWRASNKPKLHKTRILCTCVFTHVLSTYHRMLWKLMMARPVIKTEYSKKCGCLSSSSLAQCKMDRVSFLSDSLPLHTIFGPRKHRHPGPPTWILVSTCVNNSEI